MLSVRSSSGCGAREDSALLGIISASAASYFPVMLRAPGGDARSIIANMGGADEAGLRTAIQWFLVGLPRALAYLVVVFRLHRSNAVAGRDREDTRYA